MSDAYSVSFNRINTPKSWTPQELELLNKNFSIIEDLVRALPLGVTGPAGAPGSISVLTDHGLLTGLLDDDHTQYLLLAGRAGGQTVLGSTTFIASAITDIPIIVRGVLGQSVNLASWLDSTGLVMASVGNAGLLSGRFIGVNTFAAVGKITVAVSSTNDNVFHINGTDGLGFAASFGNLQLSKFGASGQLGEWTFKPNGCMAAAPLNTNGEADFSIRGFQSALPNGEPFLDFQLGTTPALGRLYVIHRIDADAQFSLNLNAKMGTTKIPLKIWGSAAHSANLTEWLNSLSVTLASISASGAFSGASYSIVNGTETVTYGIHSILHANSGGATQFTISGDNGVTLQDTTALMSLASNATSKQWILKTISATATNPLFLVQQENGGTGDIQQWINSVSGILVKITAAGKLVVPTFQLTTAPSAGYVLTSDGSGNATWVALPISTVDFDDSTFLIHDNLDPTKKIAFQISSVTTGTTRTLTAPNTDGTIALLEAAQQWSNENTFKADFYIGQAGIGSRGFIDPASLTSDHAYSLPDVDGTFVLDGSSGASFNIICGSGTLLKTTSAISGTSFSDSTTSSKKLRVILSGAVGNNSITLTNASARNYGLGNLSGNIVTVGDDPPAVASGALGKVDSTAQGADIATTNLSNTPPAGLYLVEVYLACTTADATAGTLTVTIGSTDVVGATTDATLTTFTLAATGRISKQYLLQVSSGNITYATAITGIYGTAKYAIYIRVVSLG